MSIEVRNVTKTFGAYKALDNVSLAIGSGELVALLGPSGSGKTTLLRIIAGLETPDCGTIFFHGEDATDRRVQDRRVGFVFQHYALFRHMTVFENVAFGLRVMPRRVRPSRRDIRQRVHRLLELVQLEWLAGRYPAQLSGGQRQRVALARALAVEPKVLLLDEPFGALDAQVRQELRRWLRRLHAEIHVTGVLVTHDQEEALEVADRVVVMNAGRVEQVGTPEDVFHHPATEFVLHFLGHVNVFRGRVEGSKAFFGTLEMDYSEGANSPAAPGATGAPLTGSLDARGFVRPHDLEIDLAPTDQTLLAAAVLRINAAGPHVKVELLDDTGASVQVEIPQVRYRALALSPGRRVYIRPREIKVFVANGAAAV
ncbi:MAG: sulfate ABC transporter ATP-binding protein [Planctomycetota bacterium]